MAESAITTRIRELAQPLAEALGLQIWGLELLPGPKTIVRLYVDVPLVTIQQAENPTGDEILPESVSPESVSPESVSIDQCALLSRRLGLALEVEDILPSAYLLEVSSPGLERSFFALEQLAPYAGSRIAFTLSAPLQACPGRRNFVATLLRVAKDSFTVAPDDAPTVSELDVPWALVKKARRIHIFPDELKAKPQAGSRQGGKKKTPSTVDDGGLA
jgi:ribosome maturation factor RimP